MQGEETRLPGPLHLGCLAGWLSSIMPRTMGWAQHVLTSMGWMLLADHEISCPYVCRPETCLMVGTCVSIL